MPTPLCDLKYQLHVDTLLRMRRGSHLEVLVRCTQYGLCLEKKYGSALVHTYYLDPKVAVYSEHQAKAEDICSIQGEDNRRIFCRHLGMIGTKHEEEEDEACFNWEVCVNILVYHILIDALAAMWSCRGNVLIRLAADSFQEVHAAVNRRGEPGARIYILSRETAAGLQLSRDDILRARIAAGAIQADFDVDSDAAPEALLQLHRCSWTSPSCRLLIVDPEQLQGGKYNQLGKLLPLRKHNQLRELLPLGWIAVTVENHKPVHTHAPPKIQIAETETGAELMIGLTWKGIYTVKPSLWIHTSPVSQLHVEGSRQ